MENANEREQAADGYKRYGQLLGAIGVIFNTIGIVFFLAYGANTLSVLFNVIFWMFVITLIMCILWQIGIIYERSLLLVPALICWIIQFFYCLCWTFVWFLINDQYCLLLLCHDGILGNDWRD
ncbi:uncharacterized protein LOC129573288 isoform X2 [Sitodiplosis mosellana]|uniref:uncharacterized protein LOC129573288 isoform X2 n=1 Tax=Sitodiplosis mosellana TaxID=263140 RepID=UPI0024449E5A|nr:uncharacterized protein LOC129573288 isoform X2 [Sitodiplosis mosellana]